MQADFATRPPLFGAQPEAQHGAVPDPSRRLAIAATGCALWSMAQGVAHAEEAQQPGVQRKPWPRNMATPAVQLNLADGTPWSLAAHKGQPVLLNFWATWCEPCRTEMPLLEQLVARHQAQGLQLMAINFQESESVVRRFVQSTNLKLPVLRDADGAVARAMGANIFPTTVAINRQGQAVFSVVGGCDWGRAPVSRWVEELVQAS